MAAVECFTAVLESHVHLLYHASYKCILVVSFAEPLVCSKLSLKFRILAMGEASYSDCSCICISSHILNIVHRQLARHLWKVFLCSDQKIHCLLALLHDQVLDVERFHHLASGVWQVMQLQGYWQHALQGY